MIHKQFSIYDAKAQAYLPPFILPRTEMAERTFGDCVNSKDHQFAAHPADYTLFLLGLWDDETAMFTQEPNGPQTLGNGVTYVRNQSGEKSNGTQVGNETPVLSGPVSDDST